MDIQKGLEKYYLTDSKYDEILQTILNKKNHSNDLDWNEIVEMYNLDINPDTLRKANDTVFGGAFVYEYLKSKKNEKTLDNKNALKKEQTNFTKTSINKDGSFSSSRLISMTEEDSKNPEFLMKAHGFDSDRWKILSARNTIRQVISKQDYIETLYSSFITVKPLTDKEIPLSKIEEFFNKLDRNYSKPKINYTKGYKDGKLLLMNISDLHYNLLCSKFTTNNEYNCKIAEDLFFKIIYDIKERVITETFEKVIFCIGGDMLNSDNINSTTTRGTFQNDDVHFYDAYETLCNVVIKAIDILSDIAPVQVIYVLGNHDETSGFKLAKYVDAWYRNDENIRVDYSPLPRKYYVFGKTLLCFSHKGDVKTLPSIIADEARKYWSSIETTEVFLQHLHTEQILLENNHIRIQRMPTISANSKWSNDSGYKCKRQHKTFIFDKEYGLSDVLYTPLEKIMKVV